MIFLSFWMILRCAFLALASNVEGLIISAFSRSVDLVDLNNNDAGQCQISDGGESTPEFPSQGLIT